MKKFGVILLLVFCFGLVSASVEVNNYSFVSGYSPSEVIEGEINWTISGEDYDAVLSSNFDSEMLLGEFLEANGEMDFCDPLDCSSLYEASSGAGSKSFSISDSVFGGFFVEGTGVTISEIDFDLTSDFSEKLTSPLKINFFDKTFWEFSEFSDSYFSKINSHFDVHASSNELDVALVRYCEEFYISKTSKLKVGADVGGSDSKELKMRVYGEFGNEVECLLTNPSEEDYCEVTAGGPDDYFEGVFYICLETGETTNYTLSSESEGSNWGWAQPIEEDFSVPENYSHDFDILVQSARYDNADVLSEIDWKNIKLSSKSLVELANEYLYKITDSSLDCSGGCVLPIEFIGIPQKIDVTNVSVRYFSEGSHSNDKIYSVNSNPAKVNFSGVSDLTLTNFEVSGDTNKFILSLDDEKLFEESIQIFPAPIIKSIYPTRPPAGIPVTFYANVKFDTNTSLTYNWNFGDGGSQITNTNSVVHVYNELKNYTMEVEVSAGGNLSSKKKVIISSINPEVAVNLTLIMRRNELGDVSNDIATFPLWYQEKIKELVNFDYLNDELKSMEKARDNAFEEEDFLNIAKSLYNFVIPTGVFFSESSVFPLWVEESKIKPSIIAQIAGGTYDESSNKEYQNAILRWQTENVVGTFSKYVISTTLSNYDESNLMSIYEIDVSSSAQEESYLVITKDYNDVYFSDSGAVARKVGDLPVIILNGEDSKSSEFYFEGAEEISFFVSPKLTSLILESNVIDDCNFNKVCEKDKGENPDTCRNDCKPIGLMIFYMFLIFLFVLVIYTLLQVWYKRRYEDFLFEDRRQLYNLLMFISNARARGISDEEIKNKLLKQGWSNERIDYVLRKSRGERTGMYELIPVEKVFAIIRDWRARVHISKKDGKIKVATGAKQQNVGNINKSHFRKSVR